MGPPKEWKDQPLNTSIAALALLVSILFGYAGAREKGWAVSADPLLVVSAGSAIVFVIMTTLRHRKSRMKLEAELKVATDKLAQTSSKAATERAELERSLSALAAADARLRETETVLDLTRTEAATARHEALTAKAGNIARETPRPPSPGEQAQAVRRINAARPIPRRLRELFYVNEDEKGIRRGAFNSLFVDTVLALPEEGAWDHYAWALFRLNDKLCPNASIEALEKAFEGYEANPSHNSFVTLAETTAEAAARSLEWVQYLIVMLNEEPELLARRRDAFQRWMPRINEVCQMLTRFQEEAGELAIPFFRGPMLELAEISGNFQFTSRLDGFSG